MACIRDRVDFAALALLRLHVAQVFEHLERRVEHHRAGGVTAAEAFFQGADELIAMTRLLSQEPQDDELELSLGKGAPVLTPPRCPRTLASTSLALV